MKGFRCSVHYVLLVAVIIATLLATISLYTYHRATTAPKTIDPSVLAVQLNDKVNQLRLKWNATASTPLLLNEDVPEEKPASSLSHAPPPNTSTTALSNMSTSLTPTSSWKTKLLSKTACLRSGQGSIFFHHARKAAGTTVRHILTAVARKYRLRLLESEGNTLNTAPIFADSSLLTVTLLRHPIQRILSLYWYEHVAWYHDVKKDMRQCSTMLQWVNAWRDGTTWKNNFLAKSPRSVYVEVENFFVKSLIGWHASHAPLTEADVHRAYNTLLQFDIVLLSELMGNNTQIDFVKSLFDAKFPVTSKANAANKSTRHKLSATLAKDEEEVLRILHEINKFDMMLYEMATPVVIARMQEFHPTTTATKRALTPRRPSVGVSGALLHKQPSKTSQKHTPQKDPNLANCPPGKTPVAAVMKQVGIVQPPHHKGPTN